MVGIRRFVVVVLALFAPLFVTAVAQAGGLDVEVCGSWSADSGPFQPTVSPGLTAQADCGINGQGLLVQNPYSGTHVPYNTSAGWEAIAPPGITITGIYTINDDATNIGSGAGWWGEFYWDSGRSAQLTPNFSTYGCCQASFSSQRIGWFFACATANGCSGFAAIAVGQVFLSATETRAPGIVALGSGNLWYQQGWVRGTLPVAFSANDPSGVCSTSLVLGSQTLTGPGGGKNQDAWHQCPDQTWSPQVDTRASQGSLALGEGTMPLVFEATNAAGVSTGLAYSKTVSVDNQSPTVSLSGRVDAPSTAGPQYVTATAAAGPSGVSGLGCSVDGAPSQWYPGASAQVSVTGVGVHSVTCYGANNAKDASGSVATSAPQTWTLSIRQPTVSGIGFSKLVDAKLCKRVRERVKVPAHWVTVRRHHHPVRVKRRAHTKVITVASCHPRMARRKVFVWATVTRHGRKVRVRHAKWIRVVVMPHVVTHSSKRVAHGKATTVNGWLGMPNGTALAGQTVRVLTAPDNGLGQFSQAAVATTGADGSWSATLPAGPSRVIESVYDGAPTVEPSTSNQVQVVVPAKVELISVSPRRLAWGGTVHIVGKLDGGYLPPGGALVRLRLGQGSSYTTYGVQEHVLGSGRFAATYTFGAGLPSVHQTFWFQIASLPMGGDYPWAPSDSRKVHVIVGGHPPPPARPHRHRHRSRRRH